MTGQPAHRLGESGSSMAAILPGRLTGGALIARGLVLLLGLGCLVQMLRILFIFLTPVGPTGGAAAGEDHGRRGPLTRTPGPRRGLAASEGGRPPRLHLGEITNEAKMDCIIGRRMWIAASSSHS